MEIKILLNARDIPDGSVVMKRTGTSKSILKTSVKFYSKNAKPMIIKDENVRYLVHDTGDSINVIPDNTELIWISDICTIYNFLDNIINN